MHTREIQEYVSSRCKVAETYMEHGLLAESRNIFLQISRNLENFRRKVSDTSGEFTDWFETVQKDLTEKLDVIDRRMNAGKSHPALNAFRRSEAEDENPNAVFHKGIGLKDLGLFDDALDCFRRALQNGHPPYECLVEYLDVCRQKESWTDNEPEFQGFLKQHDLLDKQWETLWRKIGVLYEKAGLKKEALEALQNAKRYRAGSAGIGQPERAVEESEGMVIELVEGAGLPAEDAEVVNTADPREEEETASLDGLTLESEAGAPVETAPTSEEIRALRDELDYIRSELTKAQELVQEYQQRYTAIMSQTNTLRKENRDLKDKLAKLEKGKVKSG